MRDGQIGVKGLSIPQKRRNRRLLASAAMLALGLGLAGCGHQSIVTNPSSFADLNPDIRNPDQTPYRIGVGDEVEIKFFFTPELNDLIQVRPDGKISIMFAQDLQAAGKTPQELANDIRTKIASFVKQPDLVVIMRSFASQKVFVGGEVTRPGPVQLNGRENLIQVLDEAGWLTPVANHEQVVLVRRDPDGHEGVYPLNVKKLTSGEDMTQNVLIHPGDMILVPPSDAVSADRWVDQYIRQILPFSTGLNYDITNAGSIH